MAVTRKNGLTFRIYVHIGLFPSFRASNHFPKYCEWLFGHSVYICIFHSNNLLAKINNLARDFKISSEKIFKANLSRETFHKDRILWSTMSTLLIRKCFLTNEQTSSPSLKINYSARGWCITTVIPSVSLFRVFHSRQFPSCNWYKKVVTENNCYCETRRQAARNIGSCRVVLTIRWDRVRNKSLKTVLMNYSAVTRRKVSEDEELKYKRNHENVKTRLRALNAVLDMNLLMGTKQDKMYAFIL